MRIILVAAASLTLILLAACSSSGGYNPTVFAFEYDQPSSTDKPYKKSYWRQSVWAPHHHHTW
ncbi:hypothetical protein [Oceanicoccus sp. KOV_DT_Chl]|uniref:hypothetical protein n=1 Tax=Oceanicoccus sp. KOV_DT_Chl TaxID=1904639 RepID=UPI0011AF9817|nr:hypothetical protein [Oceanicoccus sp. KOV_DT_Chl]